MTTIFSWKRYLYLKRVGSLLIAVALIAGMVVGCAPTPTQYNLTITSTAGGSVDDPGEGTFPYDEGTVVNLVAVAGECYEFINWTGDTVANPNSPTTAITMDAAKDVTANFAVLSYDLSVNSTDGGSVTTPGEGTFARDCGTVVDLVAEAEEGYCFVEWTGDVGTVGNVSAANTTITINGDYSITANFFQGQLIWDWYDLDVVRDNLDDNYLLMNGLDSDTAGYAELASLTANAGKGWQPIGTYANRFTGSFHGQGYEISDLFINRPSGNYIGLFGVIGSGGVIENVGVNGNVTGYDYVGGLVGMSYCAVSDSHSTCNVTGHYYVGGLMGRWTFSGGQVVHSYSTGEVTGSAFAGGLVGRHDSGGSVISSYSTGCVTSGNCAGGLIGIGYGTVNNCYSSGNATGYMNVGGLMGVNGGTVSNSYSTGYVTGVEPQYTGGLVGQNLGTISNSFWDKDTSGQTGSPGGIGKTTLEMLDFDTFDVAGWDIVAVTNSDMRDTNHIWNIVDAETYPFLSWQPA